MPVSTLRKPNKTRPEYLALKVYLWTLAAFVGCLIGGVVLALTSLGSMAGWLVLALWMPLMLLLTIVSICNIVFLIYQLVKHRPRGAVWIASIVTIIISIVFVAWMASSSVGQTSEQTAYDEQSQANDQAFWEQYARQQEIAQPREISVDEAKRLLDECLVFGFYHEAKNVTDPKEDPEASTTGVIVREVTEKTAYNLLIAQRHEAVLLSYATDAKTRCGGWPQLSLERLENHSPWGQNAGKAWTP